MPRSVEEIIAKYNEGVDAADWNAAAAEWEAQKAIAIANYTGITGLNPRIANKYRRKMEKARYKIPDLSTMKARFASKMRGG